MSKEVYTYTCAQHTLGLFVREVGAEELDSLKLVIRPHFTNCWVKGCQMPLTQVRLVRDGGLADAKGIDMRTITRAPTEEEQFYLDRSERVSEVNTRIVDAKVAAFADEVEGISSVPNTPDTQNSKPVES